MLTFLPCVMPIRVKSRLLNLTLCLGALGVLVLNLVCLLVILLYMLRIALYLKFMVVVPCDIPRVRTNVGRRAGMLLSRFLGVVLFVVMVPLPVVPLVSPILL